MNLEFTPYGNNYIAEATVKGDFNLYVELEEVGKLVVFKKPVDGGEWSCLHHHPNPLLIFDLYIENKLGERQIRVQVAQKVVKASIVPMNTTVGSGNASGGGNNGNDGCSCDQDGIEALRKEIAEITGKDPNSSSAQSIQIDNLKEVTSFLEGFENTDKLKDVMPRKMSEEELQAIKDLIK